MSDNRPKERHVELHGEGGPEHSERTLCGLVLMSPTETGPVLLAAPGSVVDCPQCRQIIADAKHYYTDNFRRRYGR
jgi:hypothetical protein